VLRPLVETAQPSGGQFSAAVDKKERAEAFFPLRETTTAAGSERDPRER
jgi:hypothetical protein